MASLRFSPLNTALTAPARSCLLVVLAIFTLQVMPLDLARNWS
jgi:hypothetical protein